MLEWKETFTDGQLDGILKNTKSEERERAKGAVETVAENTADGIIAPMHMFIRQTPLAFLYKGI